MRVFFTGHTGIEKRKALESIALQAARHAGQPTDLRNVDTRALVRVYCLEDFLYQRTGSLRAFLDTKDAEWQEDQWRAAANDLRDVLESEPAEFELIEFHTTFQRSGVVWCPLDIKAIRALEPSLFVTLIDDVYDVWRRIQLRDQRDSTNFLIRLRELATWRSVEILTTDLICKLLSLDAKPIDNLVLAVKHSPEMARRIALDPSRKPVYAACSITEPRKTAQGKATVDSEYRLPMAQRYAAFDPLTIDEGLPRLYDAAAQAISKGEKYVELNDDDRWPVDRVNTLVGIEEGLYPMQLQADQVIEVQAEISRQIQARDFRLIRQADALGAYRPLYEGVRSDGVIAEIRYARDATHKPTHIYSPESDGMSSGPFAAEQIQHQTLESFFSGLDTDLT